MHLVQPTRNALLDWHFDRASLITDSAFAGRPPERVLPLARVLLLTLGCRGVGVPVHRYEFHSSFPCESRISGAGRGDGSLFWRCGGLRGGSGRLHSS